MSIEHHTPLVKNQAVMKRTNSKKTLPNRLGGMPSGSKPSGYFISQSQTNSIVKISLPKCVKAVKQDGWNKKNKASKNSKSSQSSIKVYNFNDTTSEIASETAANFAGIKKMNPQMGNGLLVHPQKVLISESTETAKATISPVKYSNKHRLLKYERPISKRNNPTKSLSKPMLSNKSIKNHHD